MKTSLVASLAILAVFASAGADAQISVSGSAEVKVAPDEIRISVGVETRDASLEEAKRRHNENMTSALRFLKSSGVPDKDVQTDFISVTPEYGNDLSRTKPVIFIVRKSIEIKLTTVTNLEPILTGLLSNGVNYIHNVDFRTTQLRKYRDEARAMAVRAAKEKAEALAKELGVECGKPTSINANEWGGGWGPAGSYWGGRGYNPYAQVQNVVQNEAGPSDSGGYTMSLGQISISAAVNVTFSIQ
ncbi:conserved exported hypothetical protein [Verrucomicrobia bacterium]|nr:conserved exported hypothetical protein [Verrucomicrobiota bacterium]